MQQVEGLVDLGLWKPKLRLRVSRLYQYDPASVHKEWKKFVQKALGPGQRWYYVRTPSFHAGISPNTDVCQWHQDGSHSRGMPRFLIMWSNIHPTLVLPRRSEEILQLEPWHAYIIENREFYHRTPLAACGSQRWFARAYREREL